LLLSNEFETGLIDFMPWRSLLFFASLYFLQGAVLAFIINFQKPFLVNQGVASDQIAWLTSAMLFPFIGKIFLGALSDRVPLGRFGRRKPYMLIGIATTMLCYFLIAKVSPAQDFGLYFRLSVLAVFGLALFDTTADGMAIDKTRDSDQGLVQAAMLAGKSIGLITFSVFFGYVFQNYGAAQGFYVLAGLGLPIFIACCLYQAPDRSDPIEKAAESEAPAKPLYSLFFWLFALYGITYSITSFGIDGIMTLFMNQQLHFNSQDIGVYGSLRGLGALIGALLAGVFLARWSRLKSAYLALGMLFVAGLANSFLTSEQSYWGYALLWGAAWGFQETTYVTLAMSLSIGRWSATLFALTMMFSNVGTSMGEGIATSMSATYPFVAILRGLSLWLIVPVLIFVGYSRKAPRVFLHD
jgi:PAT family beta-lactamase induction signal transducer AmpG